MAISKESEQVLARIINTVSHEITGSVTAHLSDDHKKNFWGTKILKRRKILEIVVEESANPEPKKSSGRPTGSVKNI
jgi:hypothetical protein